MMLRRSAFGLGIVVCLLLAWASSARAEDIEVQVFESTDPNMVFSKDILVAGVEVSLYILTDLGPDGQAGTPDDTWQLVPSNPAVVTNANGEATFTGLGFPDQTTFYEVRLNSLPDIVPEDSPAPPDPNAVRYTVAFATHTSTASPTPMPMPDVGVPQDPPRDAERPSSGPMTTRGGPGFHRAEFPAARSRPEDTPNFTNIRGLIYRELGGQAGLFDEGTDERVGGADVEINYSDPDRGIFSFTTPGNGTFADNVRDLIGKDGGNTPPDVLIRFRETPGSAWSGWMMVPITYNVVSDRFEYLKTSTHYAVGTPPVVLKGSISGTVVKEAAPGNGQADPGEPAAPGETVELRSGDTNALISSTVTGLAGDYAFASLDAGNYTVTVPGEASRTLALAAGEDAVVDLAIVEEVMIPKPCLNDGCSAGPLHEVVLETEMWVGATPSGFAVTASLREGCSAASPAVDRVSLAYMGLAFPGAKQGLDEVLTLEDVRMHAGSGWATVRLRLVADAASFADGSFGSAPRRLDLMLNGRLTMVCWRLRCESTQPGGRFGTFRVLETLGRDAWAACTGFMVPPVPQPPTTCPCPPSPTWPKRSAKRSRKSSGKSSAKSSGKSSGKSRKHASRSRWQPAKKKAHKRKAAKKRHARKRKKGKHRSWSRWRRR